MQSQTIITFLIIVCKIIIAILLYSLIRKNRMLKQEKLKLLETNLKLKQQGEQIIRYIKELKASEFFKTKVLSIASHDLRTPLCIHGYVATDGRLITYDKIRTATSF